MHDSMRVPAVIFADEALIRAMDQKMYEQAVNVASLPGIVKAAYAMPDAHWGYGFPIDAVATLPLPPMRVEISTTHAPREKRTVVDMMTSTGAAERPLRWE